MSASLFEPYRIGRLEVKNRFVRSATWDGTADSSGAVADTSVALYQKLAQGGVGFIVSGYAFVSSLGQANSGKYGIHPRMVHDRHGWWFPEKPAPEHGCFESNIDVVTTDDSLREEIYASVRTRGTLCRIYK